MKRLKNQSHVSKELSILTRSKNKLKIVKNARLVLPAMKRVLMIGPDICAHQAIIALVKDLEMILFHAQRALTEMTLVLLQKMNAGLVLKVTTALRDQPLSLLVMLATTAKKNQASPTHVIQNTTAPPCQLNQLSALRVTTAQAQEPISTKNVPMVLIVEKGKMLKLTVPMATSALVSPGTIM